MPVLHGTLRAPRSAYSSRSLPYLRPSPERMRQQKPEVRHYCAPGQTRPRVRPSGSGSHVRQPRCVATERGARLPVRGNLSTPEDQAVFPLRESPTSDLLLSELPLYGSPLQRYRSDVTQPDYDPDALWRRPALPLSKFVEGDVKLVTDGEPTWQSKFIVDDESEDEDTEKYRSSPATRRRNWLPPESSDVALFNPEMKPIRDRLHASHQFRPPTEHLMPPQSFYENRVASQWTGGQDEELDALSANTRTTGLSSLTR